MKLTIKFNHNDSRTYPCACLIYREGDLTAWVCSVAETWAEAEAEAIAKAKSQLDSGPPPPQQKEIDL